MNNVFAKTIVQVVTDFVNRTTVNGDDTYQVMVKDVQAFVQMFSASNIADRMELIGDFSESYSVLQKVVDTQYSGNNDKFTDGMRKLLFVLMSVLTELGEVTHIAHFNNVSDRFVDSITKL